MPKLLPDTVQSEFFKEENYLGACGGGELSAGVSIWLLVGLWPLLKNALVFFVCAGLLRQDWSAPLLKGLSLLGKWSLIDVCIICDFLWADPDACTQGWAESERGVSYTFGADVVTKFLEDHDFDLMVRAHQVVEDGYEFFAQRQLVTLFSAPNYCGEFDNSGAVMSVDASLMCSFHILKPRSAAPDTPETVHRGAR